MILNNFSIQFPDNQHRELTQNEEYCIVKNKINHNEKKIRFHDYGKIYSIPGLYEYLFYEKLKCRSPQTVCALLKDEIETAPLEINDLTVLDLGAGNGLVGERLSKMGVKSVYGIDILQEAEKAAERDRPNIYEEYYIADLSRLSDSLRATLKAKNLNCMTIVAALGFGDIPTDAFIEAFNLLTIPALVAFNIKEDFISDKDQTGFSLLIHNLIDSGILHLKSQKRYQHRLSIQNKPLYYHALIGEKKADILETSINTKELVKVF